MDNQGSHSDVRKPPCHSHKDSSRLVRRAKVVVAVAFRRFSTPWRAYVFPVMLIAASVCIKVIELVELRERLVSQWLMYVDFLIIACIYLSIMYVQRQGKLVYSDFLTGVLNRGGLQTFLDTTSRVFTKHPNWISILSIDVDHFKLVNDVFGHEAGDVVLQRIAQIISRSVRKCDAVARSGGDEFIVILRGASPRICRLVARRIQRSSRSALSASYGTSVSVGAISVCARRFSHTACLREVDAMLYHAKLLGRDRIALKTISGLDALDSIIVVD